MAQPVVAPAHRPAVPAPFSGENELAGGGGAFARLAALTSPSRLVVAAAFGVLVVHTAALATRVHETSTFVGDDLVGFWLARTLPLRSFLVSPIDVHFVPLHRLVSYLAYAAAPLDYSAGLGALLAMHFATLVLLHAVLRELAGRPAAAVLVAVYGLHPCLGPLFTWWTSGLHRLGYVLFAVASLYSYLRYRRGSRGWLAAFAVCAASAVGFYSKGVLVPLYVLGLEASLRACRRTPAPLPRLLSALGVASVVAALDVAGWLAATVPEVHGVNHDPAYLTTFVELGLRVFVPTLFGVWLDPRLAVFVATLGGLGLVAAASLWGTRRALVAWSALAAALVANMVVIGASAAKTGWFGLASLLCDRYYFENVFLVVIFAAAALGPALGAASGRFSRFDTGGPRWRARGTRAMLVAGASAGLVALAVESRASCEAIRATNYPGSVRAREYMLNLRGGVAALRAGGVETISLRDTRVSPDLVALGDLVATNASLLELMNVPVRVSRRGNFVVHSDGSVSRVRARR